jgi:hypothetical protein
VACRAPQRAREARCSGAKKACGSAVTGSTPFGTRRTLTSRRLYPLQPRQAWSRFAGARLAIQQLSSICRERHLAAGLGGRGARCRRTVRRIDRVGAARSAPSPTLQDCCRDHESADSYRASTRAMSPCRPHSFLSSCSHQQPSADPQQFSVHRDQRSPCDRTLPVRRNNVQSSDRNVVVMLPRHSMWMRWVSVPTKPHRDPRLGKPSLPLVINDA